MPGDQDVSLKSPSRMPGMSRAASRCASISMERSLASAYSGLMGGIGWMADRASGRCCQSITRCSFNVSSSVYGAIS